MMIPLEQLLAKYKLKPKGVIHVGAHWAEEHEDYLKCDIEIFAYVEPCKEAFEILMEKLGRAVNVHLFNVACGKEKDTLVMFTSSDNQGQSNSFLQPLLHLKQHPEVVFNDAEAVDVVTLDSLMLHTDKFDMLVMDTEGYEGEVLKGATETLKNINIIYTEVNRGETRIGNILIDDLDVVLKDFTRVETFWPSPNLTWGDAIYISNTLL